MNKELITRVSKLEKEVADLERAYEITEYNRDAIGKAASLEGIGYRKKINELEKELEKWERGFKIELGDDFGTNPLVLIEELRNQRRKLCDALELATISSCNCLTKTPDWEYHAETCPYKIYKQVLWETRNKSLTNDQKTEESAT